MTAIQQEALNEQQRLEARLAALEGRVSKPKPSGSACAAKSAKASDGAD